MKKFVTFILLLFCYFNLSSTPITKNYIQVYGEGPKGRIPIDFEVKVYSEKETVLFARAEAFEFLSGIVYGYDFVYSVENPLINVKGHFDLNHIATIKKDDPNLSLTQLEEATQFMRIQALYRLNEDQKLYINGFRSQAGQMTMGKGYTIWTQDWNDRKDKAFKNALANAILNAARRQYQSRPQFIVGKLILRETPKFQLDAGQWKCIVKIDLVIENVSYRDNY